MSTKEGSDLEKQRVNIGTIQTIRFKILDMASSQDLASVSSGGTVYSFSALTPELANLHVGDIMIGMLYCSRPGRRKRVCHGCDHDPDGGICLIAGLRETPEDERGIPLVFEDKAQVLQFLRDHGLIESAFPSLFYYA
jgi:hypothetical protein